MAADYCTHLRRDPGPRRMPLVHGSAATDVCRDCGAWRYYLHGWSEWRPASEWDEGMREEIGEPA